MITSVSATIHFPAASASRAVGEARRGTAQEKGQTVEAGEPGEGRDVRANAATRGEAANGKELSPDELQQVDELKQRDREVRQHEQAHVAAGGNLVTAAASYSYATGPDGQRYAVGGEVSIDTSREAEPEAALAKARRIRSAALAPAEPSAQDRRVAALAGQMEMEAMQALALERQSQSGAGGVSRGAGESEEVQGSARVMADSGQDRTVSQGARQARFYRDQMGLAQGEAGSRTAISVSAFA